MVAKDHWEFLEQKGRSWVVFEGLGVMVVQGDFG